MFTMHQALHLLQKNNCNIVLPKSVWADENDINTGQLLLKSSLEIKAFHSVGKLRNHTHTPV